MSAEILLAMVLAVITVVVASATFLRHGNGFMASAVWGMFPVYGTFLPPGSGLVALVGALALIAIIVWCRTHPTPRGVAPLLMALLFAAGILVREWFDPSAESDPVGVQLLVSIVAAALVSYVGTAVRWKEGFAAGLVPGGLALSVGEVIRVAGGGVVHAPVAAFGVNPIVLAQYAGIAALVVVFQVARRAWHWYTLVLFFVAAAGVVASGSRGPLLGVAIGIVYLIVRGGDGEKVGRRRFRRLLGLAGTLAMGVFVLAEIDVDIAEWLRFEDIDGNASTRLDAWAAAWNTIQHEWLLGAGPGRFADGDYGANVGLPEYPHNIWLESWSEFGLPIVVTLALILVLVWRQASGLGCAFVLLVAVAYSFSGSLSSSLVFWVGLGLALSTTVLGRGSESSLSTDPSVGRRSVLAINYARSATHGY